MKKILFASILLMAMLPLSSSARGRVFVRPVIVPHVWYGGFGYGWYDPYWGPYPYAYGAYVQRNVGKVKIEDASKDAEVYIDGSLAGTVRDLKTFPLKGGSHTFEIREPNGRSYQESAYVLPGKTIHVRPAMNGPVGG